MRSAVLPGCSDPEPPSPVWESAGQRDSRCGAQWVSAVRPPWLRVTEEGLEASVRSSMWGLARALRGAEQVRGELTRRPSLRKRSAWGHGDRRCCHWCDCLRQLITLASSEASWGVRTARAEARVLPTSPAFFSAASAHQRLPCKTSSPGERRPASPGCTESQEAVLARKISSSHTVNPSDTVSFPMSVHPVSSDRRTAEQNMSIRTLKWYSASKRRTDSTQCPKPK